MVLEDILAAVGVVINGIPAVFLSMSYGFLAFPTGLGYLVGVIACLFLQSGIPISMQAETIVLAGSMGKDMRERLSIIFFAGVLMTCLGLTGTLGTIVGLAGDRVINGMMAGVGIILTRIGLSGFKTKPIITTISTLVSLLVYFLTNNLVYVIVLSVKISSAIGVFTKEMKDIEFVPEKRELKFQKPTFNFTVLRGALALACLTIGANIAFGSITSSMGQAELNVDHLTVYSGLADIVTSLFGGAPVESMISATGAAPNPVNAGVLMMAIMAAILFLGLLPKVGKYVSSESVYGFLIVLGAIVTCATNTSLAFAGAEGSDILLAGVPLAMTAAADPFLGLLSGIILKLFIL